MFDLHLKMVLITSLLKVISLLLNSLLAAGGVAFAMFGTVLMLYIRIIFTEPTDLFVDALLLTLNGILVVSISIFGCFGAMRKNARMVITYSCVLLLIFVLQVMQGVRKNIGARPAPAGQRRRDFQLRPLFFDLIYLGFALLELISIVVGLGLFFAIRHEETKA